MMGLSKPKLCTKLEVANSTIVLILKETPKFSGAPLAQGHDHFSSECDFIIGLGKLKLCTKFEVASFSHCKNIKGKPKFRGAPLAQGHTGFSSSEIWW